jgi:peptide/nickel transport system permease protein
MRAAAAVLALILAACLLAPLYARHVSGTDPFRVTPLARIDGTPVLAEEPGGIGTAPIGPGWRGAYLLGADSLGRDVAARLLYGGRTSLLIAAGATLLCLGFGVAAGLLAGTSGRLVDGLVSAAIDLVWAFPATLLAISLALVLLSGPLRLGPLVIAEDSPALPVLILGLVFAPYVARPVRAELVALRTAPFVEAARATGGSRLHILRRHMLPQLTPLLLGLAPIVAAMMLLTEAALSVLGLGVQAPGASWGTLIADGQALLHQRPLVAIAPGIAVAATVLALNALAEGVGGSRARR